jgi:aminopeptidase N
LHLQLTTDAGVLDTVVQVNGPEEHFVIPVKDEPRMVLVDKGYHLLREIELRKSAEEWKFQLVHAVDIADRITAAYGLADGEQDSSIARELKHAASADRSWPVRQAALAALGDASGEKSITAYRIGAIDASPFVRSTAVQLLCRYGAKREAALVDSLARHDPGVLAVCTAIRELPGIDSAMALARAIDGLKRKSYRNMVQESALAALTRLHASEAAPAVFPLLQRNNSRSLRMQAATFLGDVCRNSPEAHSAIIILLDDHDPLVRRHAVRTVRGWSTPEAVDLLRRKRQSETEAGVIEEYNEALPP